MSELRLASTERVKAMLELVESIADAHLEANFCPHCGKPNAQKSPMEDGKETLEAILKQVVASANEATEAKDAVVLHAQSIEKNMQASLVGPMFDRIRSELHDMQQRISALEMAVRGRAITTGRRK